MRTRLTGRRADIPLHPRLVIAPQTRSGCGVGNHHSLRPGLQCTIRDGRGVGIKGRIRQKSGKKGGHKARLRHNTKEGGPVWV